MTQNIDERIHMLIHYKLTLADGEHFEGTMQAFGHRHDAEDMVIRKHIDLSENWVYPDLTVTVEEVIIDENDPSLYL